jgi:hypothetical protein
VTDRSTSKSKTAGSRPALPSLISIRAPFSAQNCSRSLSPSFLCFRSRSLSRSPISTSRRDTLGGRTTCTSSSVYSPLWRPTRPDLTCPSSPLASMGFSFAHNAIQLMRLDGMITGATLLGGLFLYDIFWVFGTAAMLEKSVMVEVATGLDAPIKVRQRAFISLSSYALLTRPSILNTSAAAVPQRSCDDRVGWVHHARARRHHHPRCVVFISPR